MNGWRWRGDVELMVPDDDTEGGAEDEDGGNCGGTGGV